LLRPLRILVYVAAQAGVRGADGGIERRVGDSETVVGAVIHTHVVAARHMALDALSAGSHFKQHFALRR